MILLNPLILIRRFSCFFLRRWFLSMLYFIQRQDHFNLHATYFRFHLLIVAQISWPTFGTNSSGPWEITLLVMAELVLSYLMWCQDKIMALKPDFLSGLPVDPQEDRSKAQFSRPSAPKSPVRAARAQPTLRVWKSP